MARFGTTGSKGRICVCHLHKRDVPRRPNGVTVRRRLSSTTPTRKQPGHTAVLANGECAKWRAKISNEGHKAHLFRNASPGPCAVFTQACIGCLQHTCFPYPEMLIEPAMQTKNQRRRTTNSYGNYVATTRTLNWPSCELGGGHFDHKTQSVPASLSRLLARRREILLVSLRSRNATFSV